MLSKYERRVFWFYAANLLQRLNRRDELHGDALRDIEKMVGDAAYPELWQSVLDTRSRFSRRNDDDDEAAGETHSVSARELAAREFRQVRRARPAAERRRIDLLGSLFGLDRLSLDLVELLFYESSLPVIADLHQTTTSVLGKTSRALALLLGTSPLTVERRLAADAPLARSGLLTVDWGYCDLELRLARPLLLALTRPIRDAQGMRDALLGPQERNALQWQDFSHMAGERDFVADLLRGATAQRAAGINILLHGEPGTGKTELCRTLAVHLGLDLRDVPEGDDSGSGADAGERMAYCRTAQALLSRYKGSAVLFDESEEVLGEGANPLAAIFARRRGRDATSGRGHLHEFLETNPVPVLWTCNDIRGVHAATLRRFSYVLRLFAPPKRARERVWARSLERHDIADAAGLSERLGTLPVSPGVAAQAVRASQIAGREDAAIERVVGQLSEAMTGRPLAATTTSPVAFNPALITADANFDMLAEKLCAADARRFSICIHGPPGAGKSAWLRYLAELLGLEVEQVRASDLISKWVGETERNIAATFRRALSQQTFLIFDEADSLLQDRSTADRGWQITQVNEMLTWMESHPYPFACTTNRPDLLDEATARRFTFKVGLKYLAPVSVHAAFEHFFGQNWPPMVTPPDRLTVGDFAVVKRRVEIEGYVDAMRIIKMLEHECGQKPRRERRIGFV